MDSSVLNGIEVQNGKKKSSNSYLSVFSKIYHFISKVLLYFMILILSLVFLAFILYLIDNFKNKCNGVHKHPLFNAYIIVSPSMVPTINVNDAVVIKRKEPNVLKKGDIITFLSSDDRYSGLTVTHRIIGIDHSKKGYYLFVTKGDNNNTKDSAPVLEDNVYGKVILKIPFIGYVQSLLTKKYGWFLFIVVPCLILIIVDIYRLCHTVKGDVLEAEVPVSHKNISKKDRIDLISTEEALSLIGETNSNNNKDEENEDDLDLI